MNLLAILAIALSMGIDAFVVALAAGAFVRTLTPGHFFRMGWHFGLFQCLMPIVGWLAGVYAFGFIESFSHWVAAGLLGFVGGRMLLAALREQPEEFQSDPTRGLLMVILSLAVSMDALAIGISLAALEVKILYPAAIIGVVTAAMTVAGLWIGERLGRIFGRAMLVIGGLLLWAIAARVLLEKLT